MDFLIWFICCCSALYAGNSSSVVAANLNALCTFYPVLSEMSTSSGCVIYGVARAAEVPTSSSPTWC